MKTIVLASLIAAASAMAPAKKAAPAKKGIQAKKGAKVAALGSFEGELGAQEPLGFFDPLGLVADADQERFDRLRYVEIKHGRICMLGVLGYLTTAAGIRLPGDIDYAGTKFADIGSGWEGSQAIPVSGALQVFAFIGLLEIAVMKDITGGEFPGDFRNGYIDFGWDTFDEETKLQKRAIELNNGRAAQMGMLGLMIHDKLGNVNELFPGNY
jgi:hypothetical protein